MDTTPAPRMPTEADQPREAKRMSGIGRAARALLHAKISLPRAVGAAWIFALVIVGWVFWQIETRNLHPSCLQLLIPTSLFIVSTLIVVISSAWRVLCRTQVLQTLRWFLLGTLPTWLFVVHFVTILWITGERYVPINRVVLSAAVIGAAFGQPQLWLGYSNVTPGRRVVMYHNHEPHAVEQVAAMDKHVERLEQLLGRQPRVRANWVRGPLWGRDGFAFLGFAMSFPSALSDSESLAKSPDGLMPVDRHELAHFTINQYLSPHCHPPFVLIEGWAEAMCGLQPGTLARRAWEERANGLVPTLRQIVGPDWYDTDSGPVYTLGGPLVEYILKKWGHQKFLELYATCSRATFAADCERILGVTIDQLDQDYWADIEHELGSPAEQFYQSLKKCSLAKGVDPQKFDEFARAYASAVARSRQEIPDGVVETTETYHNVDDAGKESNSTEKHVAVFDGDRCFARSDWPTATEVVSVNKQAQFSLRKTQSERFFTADHKGLFTPPSGRQRHLRDRVLSSSAHMGRDYGWLGEYSFQEINQGHTTIEELQTVDRHGEPRIEIALRNAHPSPGMSPIQRYQFDPARDWILRSSSAKTADAQGREVIYQSDYDVETRPHHLARTIHKHSRATVAGRPKFVMETTETLQYRKLTLDDEQQFQMESYLVRRSYFPFLAQVPAGVIAVWTALATWVLAAVVTQVMIWRRRAKT